jgi:cytochrome c
MICADEFPVAPIMRYNTEALPSERSKSPMSKHPSRIVATVSYLASTLVLSVPSQAEGGDPKLGLVLAQEWCAKCHSVGLYGTSPLSEAPPFRELHKRYDVEDLAESLAEGILVGHPTMPAFRFDPDQIDNLITYLKTLER